MCLYLVCRWFSAFAVTPLRHPCSSCLESHLFSSSQTSQVGPAKVSPLLPPFRPMRMTQWTSATGSSLALGSCFRKHRDALAPVPAFSPVFLTKGFVQEGHRHSSLFFLWLCLRKLWEGLCRRRCETAPLSRECTGGLTSNQSTWKLKVKIRRMRWKMRETVKSAEWRVEEYQDNDNTMQMTHAMECAQDTWANVTRDTKMSAVKHWENVTCEGVLFTHPVGCSRLPSAVNDLATTNSKIIMISTSFHSTATMRYWKKKKTNATFDIDKKELVQVVLLQIHGGDGSQLWLFGSLIGVSSVHFCLICSVRYASFFLSLSYSSEDGQQEWSSCANLSIAMHFSSVQPIFSCESQFSESRWKRSWIPSKFFLIHLFRALWATKCSFCASVLPCRAPRGRPILMT